MVPRAEVYITDWIGGCRSESLGLFSFDFNMVFEHHSGAEKSRIQPLVEAGPNVYFSELHAPMVCYSDDIETDLSQPTL
jgi:hypothetical protein